jgi:Uma2 family endonuclease
MTTQTKTQRLTAEEFFDWLQRPENRNRLFELDRGEIVEMSRPGERHCVICSNGGFILNLYARKRQSGYVLSNDPGIIVERGPDTVRRPDLVFFDGVRTYAALNPKFAEGTPILAIEVLSPTDRIGKVMRRINQLLRSGIQIVWLIDPEARDVTVFRSGHEPYSVSESEALTGDDVLPDFRCRVADFFFMPGSEAPPAQP